MEAALACVFYFFFMPTAILFTSTVTIISCTESLKRACFIFTGSYSFSGGPEPGSLVIARGELLAGFGVSLFLAASFFIFMYIYNKKCSTGVFGNILPFPRRHGHLESYSVMGDEERDDIVEL